MGLPAPTTSVRCLHAPAGTFLGLALVQVGNEMDAERIRREYSGQIIDASESAAPPSLSMTSPLTRLLGVAYRLTVQHLLGPEEPLHATATIAPFPIPAAAQAQTLPKQQPKAKPASGPVNGGGPANGNRGGGGLDKAPGLKLLARLGKSGQGKPLNPKGKQLA